MACRRSGVVRVKMEDISKDKKEIVLTLSKRVTAKEIMQILKVNPQWRISGSTLRVNFEEIVRKSGPKEEQWLKELTEEIAALQPKKGGKKAKKKAK